MIVALCHVLVGGYGYSLLRSIAGTAGIVQQSKQLTDLTSSGHPTLGGPYNEDVMSLPSNKSSGHQLFESHIGFSSGLYGGRGL